MLKPKESGTKHMTKNKKMLYGILLAILLGLGGFVSWAYWQDNKPVDIFGLKLIEPPTVAITTDKTEYEQGRTITVTVYNGLPETIIGPASLGYLAIFCEKKIDGNWELAPCMAWPPKRIADCFLGIPPQGKCEFELVESMTKDSRTLYQHPGTYRVNTRFSAPSGYPIPYSNEFTINAKNATIPKEKLGISDVLVLFPQELQKHIARVKIANEGFSLSSLGSQNEGISLPLTNYLIEFSDQEWNHAKIEIAQMNSDKDAELLFEHLESDDKYQTKRIGNKLCSYKENLTATSVINYYANCIQNNLIFKVSFPKDKKEYISELGNAQQYNIVEELEIQDIVNNYDPSIYNAPLAYLFIHLKKDRILFSNQSDNLLLSLDYFYKPENLDIIIHLRGEVFFVKDENKAESIFAENVNYFKGTNIVYLVGDIENTKNIEFVIPGVGVISYYIFGYQKNVLFLSEIKVSGNTGSLPSMPYKPPELHTKDTLVYLKYLTKELYKNIVQRYSTQEITITTDKTMYRPGEDIEVITKNNTGKTITILSLFEFIEKFEENVWKEIITIWQCPCDFACDFPLDKFLETGQQRAASWNQGFGNPCQKQTVGIGKYRMGVNLKTNNTTTTIYSNEFYIKHSIIF